MKYVEDSKDGMSSQLFAAIDRLLKQIGTGGGTGGSIMLPPGGGLPPPAGGAMGQGFPAPVLPNPPPPVAAGAPVPGRSMLLGATGPVPQFTPPGDMGAGGQPDIGGPGPPPAGSDPVLGQFGDRLRIMAASAGITPREALKRFLTGRLPLSAMDTPAQAMSPAPTGGGAAPPPFDPTDPRILRARGG